MSAVPPFRPPSELQAEVLKQQNEELEAKAARHAQLHPDGAAKPPGPIRRALGRLRAAVGRSAS